MCVAACTSFFSSVAGILPEAMCGVQANSLLLFSPVRLIFLIAWVYLCLYSIQRFEYGPLVPQRYKTAANAFGLVIGPFILFVLTVADVAVKLQDGEIEFRDILRYVFDSSFGGKGIRREVRGEDYIELLDSSGKSFHEVYGGQNAESSLDNEILDLTKSIVLKAIRENASDILIDPKSDGVYSVRYRVDGFLRTVNQIKADKCTAVVNSFKALSSMDIAEKRRPQDGSFMSKVSEGSVYFRVASSGVLGGEKLSIRVLNQVTGLLKLSEIGLSQESYNVIADIIQQPSGMVLVCGPTGSGKSTSLYAMLNMIDFFTHNVVTIEDPIEYVLENASQIEVNVKADITFANALRSILRQDPDVICVGEIRDSETAGMAVQASQTGHLVLATLHSSSNIAALVRLIDLDIKPLLLASALSVIISQRLVRRLCAKCKSPAELTDEQIATLQRKGFDPDGIMQANGCKHCSGTGYRGRTAIVDILHLDDEIKTMLANDRLVPGELKMKGDRKSRSNLRREGLKKASAGLTTLDEVKRVTSNLG